MLNARSKEPFAMESLDSEVTMSESFSYEAEAQSTESGRRLTDSNDFDIEVHSNDILPRNNYTKSVRNDNRFPAIPANDSHFDNGRPERNFEPTQLDQLSNQGIYDRDRNSEEFQGVIKGEETQQVELDFRATIETQKNQEKDNFESEDASHQVESQRAEQESTRNKLESSQTSVASNPPKNTVGLQSTISKNKKKPTVSAETKARWAMLRSLAGTEKDADEDKVIDDSQGQRSNSQSLSFEASVREEVSLTGARIDSTDKSPAQVRRQFSPRKVSSQVDNKQFALSSKAAVESDLGRSGSGRHQSSRGERNESESSMSRAASVRRYMEKLRGDPHIDEKHLASLPPVVELESQNGAYGLGKASDIRQQGNKLKDLSQNMEKKLDGKDHHIEAVFKKDEQELRRQGHKTQQARDQDEHKLAKQIHNEEQGLNRAAQHEESILRRDAQGFKETLGHMGHGLERSSQTVTRDVGRDARALSHDVGRSTHSLGASLIEHTIETEANKVGAVGADKKVLMQGAEQLTANLSQKEQQLGNDVHKVAGALGSGEIRENLTRDGNKLAQDAHHIETALGFRSVGQELDRGEQKLRQEAGKLGGALKEESRKFEHGTQEVGAVLGIGGLESAINREGQNLRNDAQRAQAGLQSGEHMLGGLLGQAASRTDKALGHLEGQANRALDHGGHDIKNALDGAGKALFGPDGRQQQIRNGEPPLQSTAIQASSQPHSDKPHQPAQQMPHLEREMPRNQQQPSPLQRLPPSQMLPARTQNPLQQAPPHVPEPNQHNMPPKQSQAHQQAPAQQNTPIPHVQVSQSQQLPSKPQAPQLQQSPLGVGAPHRQQMSSHEGAQPHESVTQNQKSSPGANASQQQQVQPHQQAPPKQQSSSHPQMPAAPTPYSSQQASSHQQGPTSRGLPPGRRQMPSTQSPQHQTIPQQISAPLEHTSSPAAGTVSAVPKPQQLNQPQRNPQQAITQSQNNQQGQLAPKLSRRPNEAPHQVSSFSSNSGLKGPAHALPERGNGLVNPSQRTEPNVPYLPEIGLPPAIAGEERKALGNCHDETHIKAGTCTKEAPCVRQYQECKDSAHIASGACSKNAPCTQTKQAQSCQNANHHAAGVCSPEAPCTQEECCQIPEHHAKGVCSKDSPCTQEKPHLNCCKDSNHHAAGICSRDAPCTQDRKVTYCKDTAHHSAGLCSEEAPCTQNCQDQSHLATGICLNSYPCRQTSHIDGTRSQSGVEKKHNSTSTSQSRHCASLEAEETDHTTTDSTISMSPQLGPSDQGLPAPSPHVAVFEQLIFGYKQTTQTRIAAAGGARGFADQMTELFVKMAEDALPAIRKRLEDNARY